MSDLISRQAAIDAMAELQGRASTKAELKGISKAWKRIKKLPSAQPEPHWIPCSEELPTKSDTYRVSANDKSVFDLYYSVEHGWDGWWNGRISAWMPRPEPYEESEAAE